MACELSNFTDGRWDQAGAQAFYACKYFDAVESTNLVRNVIAGLQQAASFYFADKQHDIQSKNLDRLNSITEQQVSTAVKLQKQMDRGIPCENAQTDESCSVAVDAPNYAAIRSRIAASARLPFAQARRRISRRYSVHCKAAMCADERKIDLAEAAAVTAAIEAAFRKEEALYEVRLATRWTRRMNTLQHLRGLTVTAGSYLQGAMASATHASAINPYYGYSQAVNGLAGAVTGMTYQGALSALNTSAFNSGGLRQIQSGTSTFNSFDAGRMTPSGIADELGGFSIGTDQPINDMINGGKDGFNQYGDGDMGYLNNG